MSNNNNEVIVSDIITGVESVREVVIDNIPIDTKKANNVSKWLIDLEANNVKTKSNNDVQMVSKIQKYIEEEVKCY
jgi:hypothetical protein